MGGSKGRGTCIPWLTHVGGWQRLTQHYEAHFLQLKINKIGGGGWWRKEILFSKRSCFGDESVRPGVMKSRFASQFLPAL